MVSPIKQFKVDKLNVLVFADRSQMGQAAYELYRDRVQAMLAAQARVRAIFAAAHSQSDFLDALAADRQIDFRRIDAFHMDEYMGLGADAPQNFGNFLTRAIFYRQTLGSVNCVISDAADKEAESRRYEALLKEAPMDIVSLGIGENGHIAFNDPPEADFHAPRWVRLTTPDTVCRQQQVNDGEFASIDQVPTSALTLTIPALVSCRTVVGVVPGERKAEAVRRTIEGPVAESCPASILRRHDDATLFLDADAARFLL